MSRRFILVAAIVFAGSVSLVAAQQQSDTTKQAAALASATAPVSATGTSVNPKAGVASHGESNSAKTAASVRNEPAAERIEGEKRFHANCGRCHQSPHKFPPREMATIIRHMRVRATITDEDMRLILNYMTQ